MGKLHEWIGLTLSLLGLLIEIHYKGFVDQHQHFEELSSERDWKSVQLMKHCSPMIIPFLLFCFSDPGFGYYIIEGPRNLTVLAGSDARFNCTVSDGWKIIIWLFDGSPKLSVLSTGQIIQTDQRYNQQSYRNGTRFTSELIMYDVQLNDSGQIKCSIQDADDNKYAFLSVQVKGSLDIKDRNFTVRMNRTINIVCEALGWAPAPHIFWMANNISLDNSVYVTSQHQGLNGLYNEESILTLTPMTNVTVTCLAALDALSKPQYATVNVTVYEPSPIESDKNEDWRTRTIILAVVLSVVGLLLLILIILLIICCCKRKKESNYQKEMRVGKESGGEGGIVMGAAP
ncbi:Immunoglobulin superfamily member 5 [Varanus komodoensis]|nr:Immunoglobulin superfamily member 5 [Varanus komodoensis]